MEARSERIEKPLRKRNHIPFECQHQRCAIHEVLARLKAAFGKEMRPLTKKHVHKDETGWFLFLKLFHIAKELCNVQKIVVLRKHIDEKYFWEDFQVLLHDGQDILAAAEHDAAAAHPLDEVRAQLDAKQHVVAARNGKLCIVIPRRQLIIVTHQLRECIRGAPHAGLLCQIMVDRSRYPPGVFFRIISTAIL